jgi:hypothetical protein
MDLWQQKAGPRQPVDSSRGPTLCRLLEELDQIEGNFWIRLLYTHPAHWSDEVVKTIAQSKHVARYVDMPLQHIHEEMLGLMRRETSRQHIEDLIVRMREGIPGLAIRTTFITGFPGETDEHFESLLEFIERVRFERLGVFKYSQEEGSRAAKMDGQIPASVKNKRHARAMKLQQKIARELAEGQKGQTIKVLVENGLDPGMMAPMFNVNALDVAAMTGDFAILEWLEDQGHFLTVPSLEPVWRSLWEGDAVPGEYPEVMHLALFPAVAKGNVPAIRAMVNSGFRVDTPEPFNGGFPIHDACFHGQPESLETLFDLGANWDVTDRQYSGHPLGWLLVGSQHTDRPADFLRCAEILVANGHTFKTAEREGSNPFWTGHPMIQAYFRSLGAIE